MWKDEFEIIDFHSHILPGTDDGAKNLETSLKMLFLMSDQNVDKVVSTSHYYNDDEDINTFLKRRSEALFALESHIKEHDLYTPEIIPAAEVGLYPEMNREEKLSELCVGDTKNILVEMPYSNWTDWMFNELYSLSLKGYTPIIAHLERYFDMVPFKTINENLLPLDVLVQCNTDAFLNYKGKRFVKKLIKRGNLTVIGTDCHNLTTRAPNMNKALEYISKKFGDELIAVLMSNASELIGQ